MYYLAIILVPGAYLQDYLHLVYIIEIFLFSREVVCDPSTEVPMLYFVFVFVVINAFFF